MPSPSPSLERPRAPTDWLAGGLAVALRLALAASLLLSVGACSNEDDGSADSGRLGEDGESCIEAHDCASGACFGGVCGTAGVAEPAPDCAPAGASCDDCCPGLECREGFCRSPEVADPDPVVALAGGEGEGEADGGGAGDAGAGEGEGEPLLSENTDEDCEDQEDNDGDGDIDCIDEGCLNTHQCRQPGTNRESADAPPGSCTDGLDNDDDGDTDCADEACRATRECVE